jgi:tol-pal system-associated acyl-CoA thioesterase
MNGNPPSISPDGKHCYAVRVYYEDTDAGGVVYHATYLRFAERARTEALRDVGIPHAELVRQFASMFVVRHIEVDYLRPAHIDDSLIVVTEPLGGGRNCDTASGCPRAGRVMCRADGAACMRNAGERKAGASAAALARGPDRHVRSSEGCAG